MLIILKQLNRKEWFLTFFSLLFIVAQVWLDLKIPEYMGKITELVQTAGSNINDILSKRCYCHYRCILCGKYCVNPF